MEGYDASTYGDRWADVYDDWYADLDDTDACVRFLAELAGEPDTAGMLVELGIGTGCLALPLRRLGYDVRGIDASSAMVAGLHAKPGGADIPVTLGDMADVVVPPTLAARDGTDVSDATSASDGPCAGVFVAYNTFFNLSTEAAQRRCLERVATVLEPGGWFTCAQFVPDERVASGRASDIGVRSITTDRVVLTADRYDAESQTITGQYIDISAAGIALRPVHIRYLFPHQLDELAADAGLVRTERWADWARTPFDDDALLHVSVYRRPAT
jgi:SAM-dependent methyltransferase